jgi:hypothetical protein
MSLGVRPHVGSETTRESRLEPWNGAIVRRFQRVRRSKGVDPPPLAAAALNGTGSTG